MTKTNKEASVTIVERSDFADNYRAEALGDMAGLMVLKVATQRTLPIKAGVATATTREW